MTIQPVKHRCLITDVNSACAYGTYAISALQTRKKSKGAQVKAVAYFLSLQPRTLPAFVMLTLYIPGATFVEVLFEFFPPSRLHSGTFHS